MPLQIRRFWYVGRLRTFINGYCNTLYTFEEFYPSGGNIVTLPRFGKIEFINMSEPIDRYRLLIQLESIKLPWLEKKTGVDRKRWSNVKLGHAEMKANDLQALCQVWPEYAYWLATGFERPDKGDISPLTKKAHEVSKTAPKAG